MPYKNAAKHRMLNHLVGNAATDAPITHASLHTAFPATATNEITGGSPAYARKPLTYETAAGTELAGGVDVTAQPVFDVPGNVTVSAVGFWTALTAGVLMADTDVTDEVYAAQGTYTLNDADLRIND